MHVVVRRAGRNFDFEACSSCGLTRVEMTQSFRRSEEAGDLNFGECDATTPQEINLAYDSYIHR